MLLPGDTTMKTLINQQLVSMNGINAFSRYNMGFKCGSAISKRLIWSCYQNFRSSKVILGFVLLSILILLVCRHDHHGRG